MHGQGWEWSWGNQIWSLPKEKVNHCGKPPSHCLSPFRGSGFILSLSLAAACSLQQEDINLFFSHAANLSTLFFFRVSRISYTVVLFLHIHNGTTIFFCKLEHFEELCSLKKKSWTVLSMLCCHRLLSFSSDSLGPLHVSNIQGYTASVWLWMDVCLFF